MTNNLVPIIPTRIVKFRPRGATEWGRHSFTVAGSSATLEPENARKPATVSLVTDMDGFRLAEFSGPDLAYALCMALFQAECLVIFLSGLGEVEVTDGTPFDENSDTVCFSRRFEEFREIFRGHQERFSQRDT